jgi:hypothetical protein
MAGIPVLSLIEVSRVGLAERFGLKVPDWFVTALNVGLVGQVEWIGPSNL